MWTITIVASIVFFGVISIIVAARYKTTGEFKIRVIDIAISIVPILIAGVATGYVKSIGLTSDGLNVSISDQAIRAAAAKPVESQVTKLTIASLDDVLEGLDTAAKGPVGDIPRLIANGKEGLTFELGLGGYYGPAIREYLTTLIQYPFFDFVVFNRSDGTLLGVADARVLTAFVEAQGDEDWSGFENALVTGDENQLRTLPGFVDAEQSLPFDASTRDALQKMELLHADWLPATRRDGSLAGIVHRSSLTAKLILDVTQALAETAEQT